MAITQPIGLYGLWNVTFKDRVTKLPQAFFKVIGEFTFPNEADMEDYYGGGDKFIRASEPKYFKSDGTFQFKQFNKESYTYLGGAANTPGTFVRIYVVSHLIKPASVRSTNPFKKPVFGTIPTKINTPSQG